MPEAIDPAIIARNMPPELFEFDLEKLVAGFALPLVLMAAGYFFLWWVTRWGVPGLAWAMAHSSLSACIFLQCVCHLHHHKYRNCF